ncbi:S-layer homology domain-containing protein [Paenibacillus sp.]|uniref:S-layer homology domain-containing protein n=1 Tax=Paenibacillus sp. TaxID=58172 RepID=UPI002811C03F|nr:S-layer homology domain-containing protein [Paenibacillus sp.]
MADGDRISRWARDAVEAAAEQGFLSGYPDRAFKPQAQATRAEAVKVIAQIIQIIESR